MIIDSLDNSKQYDALHPLFKQAFDHIKSIDFGKIEPGRTELRGKDLFVTISDTTLKDIDDAKPEVHNNYIDIQIPIDATETFGWINRSALKNPVAPFNIDKDIQFFNEKSSAYITVTPGNFVIFFPQDGHAPCIGQGSVRKIVMKVKL